MHTAEEVRELATAWTEDDPKLHGMLLAYADLLEAMEEVHTQQIDLGMEGKGTVEVIRERAAKKARKG